MSPRGPLRASNTQKPAFVKTLKNVRFFMFLGTLESFLGTLRELFIARKLNFVEDNQPSQILILVAHLLKKGGQEVESNWQSK